MKLSFFFLSFFLTEETIAASSVWPQAAFFSPVPGIDLWISFFITMKHLQMELVLQEVWE